MFEWLGWLCMALPVLQVIGVVWCLFDLRRKSVPELWGLDWLDVLYRIEHEFGAAFERSDFEAIPAEARSQLTAGQLWDLVAAKLRQSGRPVPEDGWDRVVAVLSESLNLRRDRIAPDSRLYEDLRMQREICWPLRELKLSGFAGFAIARPPSIFA